jgi:tRNA pseudouridine38-40 synthase
MLRLEITGSAFCQQMVRSITGTLVDVGLRKLTAADVHAALIANDRSAAGQIAPPEGLILWEVGYDGTRWDA